MWDNKILLINVFEKSILIFINLGVGISRNGSLMLQKLAHARTTAIHKIKIY